MRSIRTVSARITLVVLTATFIVPTGSAQARTNPTVLAAVQRDLGLTQDQATRRMAQQERAGAIDEVLRDRLGHDFGGSWFDAASGKLVVAITASGRAAEVAAAGAHARVVKHDEDGLKAIKAKLDALAGLSTNDRRATSHRSPLLAGLVGWHVDPITNSVVVTALTGAAPPVLADLAAHGDAVRVEYTPFAPTTTANAMDGGDVINNDCSAGFNLKNWATGVRYLLTAGHCVDDGGSVSGQGGVPFGPVLERWFPGQDDALIRNDNPSYWSQGPYGDSNPSNGPKFLIIGSADPVVGSFVCKSGITTKWTCGVVRAKGESVTTRDNVTISGLTRHTACAEGGDSGGPAVLPTAYGQRAAGVTSAGDTLRDGRCLEKIGLENRAWYYPIVDSLAWYGSRHNVSLLTGYGY